MLAFLVCVLFLSYLHESHAFWGIRETLGYCTFTRKDAVECMRKYVDTNKDEKISLSELRVAKKRYMPYSLKAAGWLAKKFHLDTSIRTAVKHCRVKPFPKDGRLNKDITFTAQDFMATQKRCLPSQWALCQLKKVCDNAAAQARGSEALLKKEI